MGLQSIFSSDAELNRMNPDIFLSRLIHKAKIDVDEEGTVASAVTGKNDHFPSNHLHNIHLFLLLQEASSQTSRQHPDFMLIDHSYT